MRSEPGRIAGGVGCACDVGERVEANNIVTHVVSPLEDLGLDVDEEGSRGPSTEDHDLVGGGGDLLERVTWQHRIGCTWCRSRGVRS